MRRPVAPWWLRRLFDRFARLTHTMRRRPVRPTLRRGSLSVTFLEPREVPAFAGGVNVAVGDVNGDLFPDVITGQATGGAPLVRVVDGKTGTQAIEFFAYEQSFTGGVYVAAGDIDGDGRDEIITGTGNTGGPNVSVFDGKTGAPRYSFFPYEDSFRGGVIVAAGDTNGDGRDEIITGTGVGGGPRVQIVDGLTKQQVANFFAYEDTFRGGVLVGAGDTDGDGKDEVLTGTGVGGGPRVQAIDAVTKQSEVNFFAYESSFRGGVLVGAGDLDGDGKDEVFAGTGPGGGPVVAAYGADTKERARFLAYDGAFRGGVVVAGADMTGDGKSEFICGPGPGGDPTVRIFSQDGKQNLVSFTPFDPVAFPNKAVSVEIRHTTPNPNPNPNPSKAAVNVNASLQSAGLQSSASQVVVGKGQQLIFTSRAEGSTPSRVQLFNSDATGAKGDFLLDLFDDGMFVHRDSNAGDGVFSNSFTVNYPSAGDKFYLAELTVGDKTVTQTAKVVAIAAPSDAVITERAGQASQLQSQLDTAIASGQTAAAALDSVQQSLQSSPTTVQAGSIARSPAGIYWRTAEGYRQGVLVNVASTEVQMDPAAAAAAAADCGCTLPNVGTPSNVQGPADPLPLASATTADCKGKALVISPYYWQFAPNDPSDSIIQTLTDAGYEVTNFINRSKTDTNVTVDSFKNLGQYDAVYINSHGDNTPDTGNTTVVLTGQKADLTSIVGNIDDVMADRMTIVGDQLALNPSFFQYHSGEMNGAMVTIQACRSAYTDDLARVFVSGLGAEMYAGYSDYVYTTFGTSHSKAAFEHLAADGTVATLPGIGDTETRALPAELGGGFASFSVWGDGSSDDAKLTPKCDFLADTNLLVTYTWPTNQKDLDTGTQFVGGSVGYACGGSPYMTFSGDDTSAGGRETIEVNLYQAYQDGKWKDSVPVNLIAGWYIPAEGSGPASVTVEFKSKSRGTTRGAVTLSISPGAQRDCATTVVGTTTITVAGTPGQERVSFTVA